MRGLLVLTVVDEEWIGGGLVVDGGVDGGGCLGFLHMDTVQ